MSSMPPPPPPPSMPPPPGYVGYGGVGESGGTFQRIGGLTKALVVLTAVTLAANALNLLVQLGLRSKAVDFREGRTTISEFSDKLGPYVAASALVGLVGLAALIVQIVWTFRIARNLRALGRQPQFFSPGVTIAVNILGQCTLGILPYFMWRELWKGSDPAVQPGDPSWKQRPVGQVVHLWFVATLLTVAVSFGVGVGAAVTRINNASDERIAKQLDNQIGLLVIAGVLAIVASLMFIALVKQLSARHIQATGVT